MTLAVGMGEVRASKDPDTVLVAYGLGSCVGVCIYDPVARVGGLAHVMLPYSAEAFAQGPSGKFADCAIPMLIDEVTRLGASARRLAAKIAGGAQLLDAPGFGASFNVGQRNVEAVKAVLDRYRVPLLAAETGGKRGRTLAMHVGSCRIVVRIFGEKEIVL